MEQDKRTVFTYGEQLILQATREGAGWERIKELTVEALTQPDEVLIRKGLNTAQDLAEIREQLAQLSLETDIMLALQNHGVLPSQLAEQRPELATQS